MKPLYFLYLDEFGHEGPFISRNHARHKTSPVFGLGGFLIPSDQLRSFGTWFYKLKCHLLDFEIKRDRKSPYTWEKKGSALYTTTNIIKYPELRKATFRILNKIEQCDGRVFYVGIHKDPPQDHHCPKKLYRSVLRETIKRIDQFCSKQDAHFFMFLDEKEGSFREEIVREAATQMYGSSDRKRLIEPPVQAESHLFQTLQCADWLCGLIGRLTTFQADSNEYRDFEWSDRYFSARLKRIAPNSGIRSR